MTQSNKNDSFTIDVGDLNLDDIVDTTGNITINLDNTYTSSYTMSGATDTITISDGTYSLDTHAIDWTTNNILGDTRISPEEIEKMCKEYPGLEKVWRNFKSVYDMCKQDFEGKKKAGEIDDDIPF